MSKQTAQKGSFKPYHIANAGWLNRVDEILLERQKMIHQNNPGVLSKLRNDLKNVIREAIVETQKQLSLANLGKSSSIKTDSIGWTTGDTVFETSEHTNKSLVKEICLEVLKEQEKEAQAVGSPISQQALLNAQADALDPNKKDITIESVPDAQGNQSKLVVGKENGDTEIFEKDKKTGVWKKIGITGKRWWGNVKDFCWGIYNWCAEQCSRFWNWIKGIFRTPDDKDVISQEEAEQRLASPPPTITVPILESITAPAADTVVETKTETVVEQTTEVKTATLAAETVTETTAPAEQTPAAATT